MSTAVDGELGARAIESAGEIARALAAIEGEAAEIGSGSAGLALMYAYLDECDERFAGDDFGARADELLGASIRALASEPLPPWFYGGFVGVAWVVEHVAGAEGDDPDANLGIDQALLELAGGEPWRGDYDLFIGLVGLARYALERAHRPGGRALLVRVLDHVEALAIPAARGLTWHTSTAELPAWQQELAPDGYFNLGMAHGVPGLIAVLARVLERGIEPERTARLLEGAVDWVIGAAGPQGEARYSQWITDKDQRCERPARSGWCYGDPGPAAALYTAGVCAGRREWIELGLALARGVAERPVERAGIFDACLCHGSGSLVQLFTRLYRATGQTWAREAARRWVEWTLNSRDPGSGIAGYRFASMGDDGQLERVDRPGFLAGAAGTALALIAAATATDCDWDRALLLDLPILID